MLQWCCSRSRGAAPTEPVAVTDPNAQGEGPCADTTLADVIAAVHAAHPELASVSTVYDPNHPSQEDADPRENVYVWSSSAGYRLAFYRGFGDCPSGCIDHEYFYFETDAQCAPVASGDYHLIFDQSHGCMRVSGMPLWGIPSVDTATSDCTTDLDLPPGLNDECIGGDECPLELTPMTFVPVEGGDHACLCGIPCEDNPDVCPGTTTCTHPPDLPLTLCI